MKMQRGIIMKTYIGFILTIIIVCNLQAENNHSLQDTLYEIFPLKTHLHYTYDYYSRSATSWVTALEELKIDSGTVEYIVHDSTAVNDTLIQWNIEERRSILHIDSISLYGPLDSTYSLFDTTFFSLSETTTRLHQLSSTAFVWRFPLVFPSDTLLVHRLSYFPTDTIGTQWYIYDPCKSGNDTLLFLNELGFVQRISSTIIGGCHNTRTYISTRISLHSSPVLSVIESKNYQVKFNLEQNYPNPFNSNTIIQYVISSPAYITLRVYDLLGRQIKTLAEGLRNTGLHSVSFHADNLTSGIYFYRLNVGGYVETKKLLLVK
jgi:hypothetical protein